MYMTIASSSSLFLASLALTSSTLGAPVGERSEHGMEPSSSMVDGLGSSPSFVISSMHSEMPVEALSSLPHPMPSNSASSEIGIFDASRPIRGPISVAGLNSVASSSSATDMAASVSPSSSSTGHESEFGMYNILTSPNQPHERALPTLSTPSIANIAPSIAPAIPKSSSISETEESYRAEAESSPTGALLYMPGKSMVLASSLPSSLPDQPSIMSAPAASIVSQASAVPAPPAVNQFSAPSSNHAPSARGLAADPFSLMKSATSGLPISDTYYLMTEGQTPTPSLPAGMTAPTGPIADDVPPLFSSLAMADVDSVLAKAGLFTSSSVSGETASATSSSS